MIHGSNDQLAPVGGSNYMNEHISSVDKTLKLYDNAFHELFNDTTRDEVKADLLNWLNSHL